MGHPQQWQPTHTDYNSHAALALRWYLTAQADVSLARGVARGVGSDLHDSQLKQLQPLLQADSIAVAVPTHASGQSVEHSCSCLKTVIALSMDVDLSQHFQAGDLLAV